MEASVIITHKYSTHEESIEYPEAGVSDGAEDTDLIHVRERPPPFSFVHQFTGERPQQKIMHSNTDLDILITEATTEASNYRKT